MINKKDLDLCTEKQLLRWVALISIGMILGAMLMYSQLDYIHDTPVGGFVFRDEQVYNLCVVDGLDVKLVTRGGK